MGMARPRRLRPGGPLQPLAVGTVSAHAGSGLEVNDQRTEIGLAVGGEWGVFLGRIRAARGGDRRLWVRGVLAPHQSGVGDLGVSAVDRRGARSPRRGVSAISTAVLEFETCAHYVVMPRGGGGVALTVLASSGVHLSGRQVWVNTHTISDVGRAALGAMSPAHPSRHSCSPTR